MEEPEEQALRRAIASISQADPLIKLLQQVRAGRLRPTDASLRAVTESWLSTYQKVLATERLSAQSLRRLDPSPRLAVLIQAGILPADHPAVIALEITFQQALTAAS